MVSPEKDSLGFFEGGGLISVVKLVDLRCQQRRYFVYHPLANLSALHSRAVHHFIEKVHHLLELWNVVVELHLLLGPFLEGQQRSLMKQQGSGRLGWLSILLLLPEDGHDFLNFSEADTSKTGKSFQDLSG